MTKETFVMLLYILAGDHPPDGIPYFVGGYDTLRQCQEDRPRVEKKLHEDTGPVGFRLPVRSKGCFVLRDRAARKW